MAFEMGRQITAVREAVALLALIDAVPGIVMKTIDEDTGDPKLLKQRPMDDIALFRSIFAPSLRLRELSGFDPEEKLKCLVNIAKTAGRLAPDFDPVQVRDVLKVCRANLRAHANYVPGPYGGRVRLFESSESSSNIDLARNWKKLCTGDVETHTVTGTHNEMIRQPHATALAELLDSSIKSILAEVRRAP